jgi:hypothetical protein
VPVKKNHLRSQVKVLCVCVEMLGKEIPEAKNVTERLNILGVISCPGAYLPMGHKTI